MRFSKIGGGLRVLRFGKYIVLLEAIFRRTTGYALGSKLKIPSYDGIRVQRVKANSKKLKTDIESLV